MIALIQRVTEASVAIDGLVTAKIASGLLALVGIEKGDSERTASVLLDKMLSYRVFADKNEKMNLSLEQCGGGLLVVPQFTLVADTQKGLRPGFDRGEKPMQAEALFDGLIRQAQARYSNVHSGSFGADMQVQLINDGPVTFWLQVTPERIPDPAES